MTDFNPLQHPILFSVPERLTPFACRYEFIPFAMLLVELLRPRTILELGTRYGDSYCAFCQAVSELKTETSCYAIGNWPTDIYHGEGGSEVMDELRRHHDSKYASFSLLLNNNFADALTKFEDGTIDLLHLNGTHTFETIKRHIDNWLPKLSRRGIVVLYDADVREGNLGVGKIFDEVKECHPDFEFLHCQELGISAIGANMPDKLKWLLDADPTDVLRIKALFGMLGQLHRAKAIALQREKQFTTWLGEQIEIMQEKEQLMSEITAKLVRAEMNTHFWHNSYDESGHSWHTRYNKLEHSWHTRYSESEHSWHIRYNELERSWHSRYGELGKVVRNLHEQLLQISSSKGWSYLQKLWRLKRSLARLFGRHTTRETESVASLSEEIVASASSEEIVAPASSEEIVASASSEEIVGSAFSEEIIDPASSEETVDSTEASSLLYMFDSITISDRRTFIARGWLFNKLQSVVSLQLEMQTPAGKKLFDCKHGLLRNDVYKYYGVTQSLHSGFSAAGHLDTTEIWNVSVIVKYSDGRVETARASHSNVISSGAVNLGKTGIDELFSMIPLKELRALPSARDAVAFLEKLPAWSELQLQDKYFITHIATTNSYPRKISLVVDHNLGGGANYYRSNLIERLINQGHKVLLVYYSRVHLEYNLEFIDGITTRQTQLKSIDTLASISSLVKLDTIFVNNLYSYDDPLEVIRVILTIKDLTKTKLVMAAHDYLCVCPELNLLDKDGRFCGVPDISVCHSCLPNNYSEVLRFSNHKDIVKWREVWGRLLSEADEILCFSNSTISLMERAYPELDVQKLKYRPHMVDYLPNHKPSVDLTKDLHIGVVGLITHYKGARLVEEIADLIYTQNFPVKLTIIGTIQTDKQLPGVEITSSYRREDLARIIEQCGVNICLLPSIWPETFSYVAEELMILGMPLAVFNLGAPAERVSSYPKGLILSKVGDAATTLSELIGFYHKLKNEHR